MTDTKNAPAAKTAPAPQGAPEEPRALPYASVPSKAHLDALVGQRSLGLDHSSAALLLAVLLVDKGEKWLAEAKAPQLLEAAEAFSVRNPPAWRAMLATNELQVTKFLDLYSTDSATHVAPEEYRRIKDALAAAP